MAQPDPFFELFPILFAAGSLLFVGVLVVVSITRSVHKVKKSGHDPMTLQSDLATRTLDSELLGPAAPERSTKDRLDEVDALRAACTITAEEHAAARADILRGI